ncbi:hypothetical protein ASF05_11290 [Aeromicrobium sp. Leaf245]|nr:hypothetical protein ASF05_11290 [Aeromicrobium sp. Leaf245]
MREYMRSAVATQRAPGLGSMATPGAASRYSARLRSTCSAIIERHAGVTRRVHGSAPCRLRSSWGR